MALLDSKNIFLLIFGGIISLAIALSPKFIPLFNLNDLLWIYVVLGISLALILIVIFALHTRINEIKDTIDNQGLEIKKLNEKLKIYDRLARIEEVLKI